MVLVLDLGEFRGRNGMDGMDGMRGIVAGRMGVHFVVVLMVLVGLLEASIAARREQDYYCLPIDWKLQLILAEYFFFFTVRITLSIFMVLQLITTLLLYHYSTH